MIVAITACYPVPVATVIPNQRINLVLHLRCRCRGWSAAVCPLTDVFLTYLYTIIPTSNWADIYGILIKHTSSDVHESESDRTSAFHNNKLNYHSVPSTYVHSIHHFAMLVCNARHWLDHRSSWWRWTVSSSGGRGKKLPVTAFYEKQWQTFHPYRPSQVILFFFIA
jgi:hypothetical protein